MIALRGDLVAGQTEIGGGGTDEGDTALLAPGGELAILGQIAVSRMYGVGSRAHCRVDDALDVEVALGAHRRTDTYLLIGELEMQGIDICLGMDSDGLQADLLARTYHPERDLTSIGNQNPGEHRLPPYRGIQENAFTISASPPR